MNENGWSFRERVLWLAALFEGEGHFGRQKKGTLIAVVSMTDRDVIERARRLLQTQQPMRIDPRPPNKTVYAIHLPVKEAAGWMMILYQFLGARRRAQITAALDWWRTTQVRGLDHWRCGHPLKFYGRKKRRRQCPTCTRERMRRRIGVYERGHRQFPVSNVCVAEEGRNGLWP